MNHLSSLPGGHAREHGRMTFGLLNFFQTYVSSEQPTCRKSLCRVPLSVRGFEQLGVLVDTVNYKRYPPLAAKHVDFL